MIIRSFGHVVSAHADVDGNFRAVNPEKHPGLVGYGRTQDEARENLSQAISSRKIANPLALVEAIFMTLSDAEQSTFLADVPKLRRS